MQHQPPSEKVSENNSNITLAGSATIVSKFLFYGINAILYQREVYMQDSFKFEKYYGVSVMAITNEEVREYLENVTNQFREWLLKKEVRKVYLEIQSLSNEKVLEKWCFEIDQENVDTSDVSNCPNKEMSDDETTKIQDSLRRVIRQIVAANTLLPIPSDMTRFDVLFAMRKGASRPDDFSKCKRGVLSNPCVVNFNSFKTSSLTVKPCVAYKGPDKSERLDLDL